MENYINPHGKDKEKIDISGRFMGGVEQRRATRHQGTLPIEFFGGAGTTRDISASGIFFETDRNLFPGQSIEFFIQLEHLGDGRPVSLKCRGEIVRVEEKGQKLGVAVAIKSSSFSSEKSPNAETGEEEGQIKKSESGGEEYRQ